MGSPKSQGQDEIVLALFRELLADLAQRHPSVSNSLGRDWKTFQLRYKQEGISFATKTLPKFGKIFDRALDVGILEAVPYFSKVKDSRVIPTFLSGMLKMLFASDGTLVGENPAVIQDIRQVLYLVYKLELDPTPSQESRVIESFIENEVELRELYIDESSLKEARNIVHQLLSGFDPREIQPRHGPGAVATGERMEEKWVFSRLFQRIHQSYPYYEYFIVGKGSELLDRVEWYRGLHRLYDGEARVVLVPKDSRGPRLISCEPLEFQWIQQGINRALVDQLEQHPLSKGRINFRDQSVNQDLARESSRHHFYCTLDLKDASDRVSLDLVKILLPSKVLPYLLAARSRATRLPDGRVIYLKKFAPMGSAICFSIEALCFWAICVAAVRKRLNWSLHEAASHTYVYGDDIIVPTIAFDEVVVALESAGLKVNTDKCCSYGNFRESCGVDAYNGFNVTPTRISTCWSSKPSSGTVLASYAAYANNLEAKGYVNVARTIRESLSRIHGVLPYGTASSSFPCVRVETAQEAYALNSAKGFKTRINKNTQTPEVWAKALRSPRRPTTLDDWPRLLKTQAFPRDEAPDEVVLTRSTQIRYKWHRLAS